MYSVDGALSIPGPHQTSSFLFFSLLGTTWVPDVSNVTTLYRYIPANLKLKTLSLTITLSTEIMRYEKKS
jgi:hypothetical protein